MELSTFNVSLMTHSSKAEGFHLDVPYPFVITFLQKLNFLCFCVVTESAIQASLTCNQQLFK